MNELNELGILMKSEQLINTFWMHTNCNKGYDDIFWLLCLEQIEWVNDTMTCNVFTSHND